MGPAVAPVLLPPVALSVVLVLVLLGAGGARGWGCPKECVCASDLLSCSKASLRAFPAALPPYLALLDLSHNELGRLRSDWSPARLPRLRSLVLSHNGLSFVSGEAFGQAPHLRYLDLSCNALAALGEGLFSRLAELEVLLLYGNRIAAIDRSAFEEAAALRALYLGHNRIARFPLELVKAGEALLPQLALLDLSANQIKHLSAEELGRLPAWLKNGLYLHGNPLACRCDLFHLFAHWRRRRLSPAVDFEEELRCLHAGQRVRVSRLAEPELMNCSEFQERGLEVHRGEKVTLDCDTRQRGLAVREWLTPRYERVPRDGPENGSLTVLANGSLQIANASLEDAGPYACYAVGRAFNETLYVHVTVHNYSLHGIPDTLNTAYTTLVGCILSVVLVLIYLYLTPCRCWCRGGEKQGSPQEDSINSSVLSATPNHNAEGAGGKDGSSRHAGQSGPRGQNGKCKPDGSPPPGEKGGRKMSDPDSVSSVFSDTPIVGGSQNEGGRGGSRDKGGAELVGLL